MLVAKAGSRDPDIEDGFLRQTSSQGGALLRTQLGELLGWAGIRVALWFRQGCIGHMVLALLGLVLSAAPRVETPLFSLALPLGWHQVPLPSGFADVPSPRLAGQALRIAGKNGYFFEVQADPLETDVSADASWVCEPNPTGDGIVVRNEGKRCSAKEAAAWNEQNPDSPLEANCPEGDGRLDLWVVGIRLRGHVYAFHFGHEKREGGVDVAIFRQLLRSFRVKLVQPK